MSASLADYVQHKADCGIYRCATCHWTKGYVLHATHNLAPGHEFQPKACSCGLADLLKAGERAHQVESRAWATREDASSGAIAASAAKASLDSPAEELRKYLNDDWSIEAVRDPWTAGKHYGETVDVTRFVEAVLGERAHQWQPIETAPKDGTTILVYSRSLGCVIVRYAEGDDEDRTNWHTAWDFTALATEPTHWMTLPEAP